MSEKVFGFDLVGSANDTIHLSACGDLADSLHDLVQIGKLYMVSNGTMKPTNTNYNHLDSKWEVSLSATSTIEPSLDDDPTIPFHHFHFKSIDEIRSANLSSIVDIIGIVMSTSPTSTIRQRDGSEALRKTLSLEDMSGYNINITLWGEHCHTLGKQLVEITSSGASTMLSIKGDRIAEFNGRTVGTISTTSLMLDPAIPKTKQLQSWFHQRDSLASSPSLSRKFSGNSKWGHPQHTIVDLIDSHPARKPTWFFVRGTITSIDMQDFYFLA